jgi:DNA-binding transcriptional MerR regulator
VEKDMESGPFTLAQLARITAVSTRDIRFYADRRLLQPPRRRRSRSGDVAFHGEHVERLRFIRRALAVGYSLDDIGRLVDPNALVTCRDVYETTAHRVHEEQAKDPERAAGLKRLMATCPGVGSRTECPILSRLGSD